MTSSSLLPTELDVVLDEAVGAILRGGDDEVGIRLRRYRADPVDFATEVLHMHVAPYQADIMRQFVIRRRMAVRAPHGIGKTTVTAALVLWAVATADVDTKVVTTAGAWRQLTFFLWPEIKKWAHRASWDLVGLRMRQGVELLEMSIKTTNCIVVAAASDNAATMEGAHASRIFYFFDEAKIINADVWDAAEGAFSTGEAYAFACSTPGEPSGRFYEIHKRRPGLESWGVRHVTIDEGIAAGRINRQWVEDKKRQWGEQSAVYQNRVLGEFADASSDSVIPLKWIELAVERWQLLQESGLVIEGNKYYGVDPAYKGADKTTIATVIEFYLAEIQEHALEDTMATAGRVAALADTAEPIGVDVIGIGAGVFDRLSELGFNAIPVNVSEKSPYTDTTGQIQFYNLRAYIWWLLRERLDPAGEEPAAIPPSDQLIGDLAAPQYKYTSSGKIQVESKDDLRRRLGRSTDYADAWGLAEYAKRNAMSEFYFFG